jgi:hypothetical protein
MVVTVVLVGENDAETNSIFCVRGKDRQSRGQVQKYK